MFREDQTRYDDYMSLKIPAETENRWRLEIMEHLYDVFLEKEDSERRGILYEMNYIISEMKTYRDDAIEIVQKCRSIFYNS